ncbi:MAG: cation-translocating P-type ATPase [Methanobrevibacter sp.]|nr:cation-translocating P-type ATPase [Methanobrevibacter sp.]
MKFNTDEKIKIIIILISTTSLIVSFILSLEYISLIATILCGIPIFKECIEGLIKEFNIKTDLLVSIAIIASLIIGEIFAAGEIATIMAIGGFLEEYIASKAQSSIKELIELTPGTATRITEKKEEQITVDEIKVGDILKILPGESIPTDGIIINGKTSIDQSSLTGESIPVEKIENDYIYGGTINQNGSFTMKATKISKDSSIQRLIKLVESTKPENSKITRLADKWATWIVIIAFFSSIITYLFTGEIIRSVTILVVFCPCALVLATPTAIMAAISNLTKHKILVKDGKSLEELSTIDEVVFDKTGTVTKGNLKIINIKTADKSELIKLLTSLESKSQHPLAKAILKDYENINYDNVKNFKMHIGGGVSGVINESIIIAGNRKLFKEKNIPLKYVEPLKNGEIEIFVSKDSQIIGRILLADTLRENSKKTIENLNNLGIKTALLTGDNKYVGKRICEKINIEHAKYECLPEDKINYIKQEQQKGHKVAMIGDGINDAPSLKKANVGISMGNIGSDIAIKAAPIILINDNIGDIPHMISLCKKMMKIINSNIISSLILNFTAMSLAIIGVIEPITGALIHNIGSVIVIVYSTTLITFKTQEKNITKI